jgi:exodeoxyribonuclease V gamma subunit
MFLHRSNRSERLVDRLAEVVRQPLRDPLAAEVIVVQSKGMERFLAMALSERLGVFANAQFPFPRHLLERVGVALVGAVDPAAAAFEQRALIWSLAALLPERLAEPAFAPLARYLEGDSDGRLRIQLAERIARVFDDYGVYRPELLLRWERGEEQGWDAQLFRALVARHGRGHQAARAERMLAALAHGGAAPALRGGASPRPAQARELPERLCLFGISSLPPLYLSLFAALSQRIETHLFLLSPSREYFGDLRAARAMPASGATDPVATEGHPLLASLGRLGREFQQLLEERTQYVESERDLYVDPGTATLLHALQSDILSLRRRGAGDGAAPRLTIAPGDESIAIHVAHGPMREIEVLHDQLTALLEDPQLEPHEIAVMAPDIEVYAQVIEAVFGQSSGRPSIPFSVADRKTKSTHQVVDALYALLDALRSRMSASTVLDLLSLDCIRRRFGIGSEELERVRAWVEESGVRWGADAEHRAEVGQPELSENTWRFGLDRMLLGYALQGQSRTLYAGVLPYDPIEGSAAELLGKLAELCDRLFHHRKALTAPRPVRAYCEDIAALLADLVAESPATAHEHELTRSALAALTDGADAARFTDAIDLRSLRGLLEGALDARLPARGLLSRGVTFCQLVPMRSIPFKVVCLIGMNDGAFPGANPQLGFDRLAETGARPGDRSRRDDDRYMFLEALLCARERLILSYVGRSIHDNHVLPPSVLVGELIDTVAAGFEVEGEPQDEPPLAHRAAVEQRLCVLHRLHAFSPRYFEATEGDRRLFSYAQRDCEGARALDARRVDPRLISEPLAETEPLRELTLDELISWVTLPIRTFAQRRLGLHLGDDFAPLADREPIALDALSGWQLGTDLLELALDGADEGALFAIARARGELPLGTAGELDCEAMLPGVRALASAVLRQRGGARLPPLSIALEQDGVRITGTLRELWPNAHVLCSYSKIGRRFELAHFVRHVVLCCALARDPRPEHAPRSVVVARDARSGGIAEIAFTKLADPEALLRSLLALVRAARVRPLPFVYESARAYADCAFGKQPGDPARGLQQAAGEFKSFYGEQNPYVKLFYPSFDELRDAPDPNSFTAIAELLFTPFFRHRTAP